MPFFNLILPSIDTDKLQSLRSDPTHGETGAGEHVFLISFSFSFTARSVHFTPTNLRAVLVDKRCLQIRLALMLPRRIMQWIDSLPCPVSEPCTSPSFQKRACLNLVYFLRLFSRSQLRFFFQPLVTLKRILPFSSIKQNLFINFF